MSNRGSVTNDDEEVENLVKPEEHADNFDTLLTSSTSILSADKKQEGKESDRETRKTRDHEDPEENSSGTLSGLETGREDDTECDLHDSGIQYEVSSESEKKIFDEFTRSQEKELLDFLHSKGLSENLIKQLRENELTEEIMRLLKDLDFTDEDIAKLCQLRKNSFKVRYTMSTNSSISVPTISSENVISDAYYLKKYFEKLLPEAISEIVKRKPYDPIEYLGHWLLHFKVREEKERKRKEFEADLITERERLKALERMEYIGEKTSEVTEVRDEEEQLEEDWNFSKYQGI